MDLLVDLLFAVDSGFLKAVFPKVFIPIWCFHSASHYPYNYPTIPVAFNFLYALVTP